MAWRFKDIISISSDIRVCFKIAMDRSFNLLLRFYSKFNGFSIVAIVKVSHCEFHRAITVLYRFIKCQTFLMSQRPRLFIVFDEPLDFVVKMTIASFCVLRFSGQSVVFYCFCYKRYTNYHRATIFYWEELEPRRHSERMVFLFESEAGGRIASRRLPDADQRDLPETPRKRRQFNGLQRTVLFIVNSVVS